MDSTVRTCVRGPRSCEKKSDVAGVYDDVVFDRVVDVSVHAFDQQFAAVEIRGEAGGYDRVSHDRFF